MAKKQTKNKHTKNTLKIRGQLYIAFADYTTFKYLNMKCVFFYFYYSSQMANDEYI